MCRSRAIGVPRDGCFLIGGSLANRPLMALKHERNELLALQRGIVGQATGRLEVLRRGFRRRAKTNESSDRSHDCPPRHSR